jgi:hypothetical protein
MAASHKEIAFLVSNEQLFVLRGFARFGLLAATNLKILWHTTPNSQGLVAIKFAARLDHVDEPGLTNLLSRDV